MPETQEQILRARISANAKQQIKALERALKKRKQIENLQKQIDDLLIYGEQCYENGKIMHAQLVELQRNQ